MNIWLDLHLRISRAAKLVTMGDNPDEMVFIVMQMPPLHLEASLATLNLRRGDFLRIDSVLNLRNPDNVLQFVAFDMICYRQKNTGNIYIYKNRELYAPTVTSAMTAATLYCLDATHFFVAHTDGTVQLFAVNDGTKSIIAEPEQGPLRDQIAYVLERYAFVQQQIYAPKVVDGICPKIFEALSRHVQNVLYKQIGPFRTGGGERGG